MTDLIELHTEIFPPKSGNKPKQLVILLHGYGSNAADLIGLAPEFSQVLPDAVFISPNAPFPCEMSPGGYQWFSLDNYTDPAMYEGACMADSVLNHYIDAKLKEYNLTDENLALIGFSQGTMMSLHTGLRRENACAGILGFSGRLLTHEPLADHIKNKPAVALVHGVVDPVVPFASLQLAVDELATNGIKADQLACPNLPHGIDGDGIEFGKQFLLKIFK
jgi:phospholipase/carboxylesterase